jgi:hypothetical protein
MRALLLALTAVTASAADPEKVNRWDLTCGSWGPAPLNMVEITIESGRATFGDCSFTYQRESHFETIRYDIANSKNDTYDAFLFRLGALVDGNSCSGSDEFMLMEIPRRQPSHARISYYKTVSDLPSEEQRLDARQFFKGKVSSSAGYGLRSAGRNCNPKREK